MTATPDGLVFSAAVHQTRPAAHDNLHMQNTQTHNDRFTALVPGLRKGKLPLYGARGDIRGRHADNPAGRDSNQTSQRPASLTPHFYAGCPSCCNPPNLSWFRTGTKYAGLVTQWLGTRATQTIKYDHQHHCHRFNSGFPGKPGLARNTTHDIVSILWCSAKGVRKSA